MIYMMYFSSECALPSCFGIYKGIIIFLSSGICSKWDNIKDIL
jgi:hypothetical protein